MGKANTKKHGQYCTYIVARYKKAGNWGGEYKKNVAEGSFTKELCEKLDEILTERPAVGTGGHDRAEGDEQQQSNNYNNEAEFAENGLEAHNSFRSIHGSVGLKLDRKLTEDAEMYAKELSKMESLRHAQLQDVGENLAYGCSAEKGYELSAAEATKKW